MNERTRQELWLWKICAQAAVRLFCTRQLVETLKWFDARLVERGL